VGWILLTETVGVTVPRLAMLGLATLFDPPTGVNGEAMPPFAE
jgi:hypothetical protein